MLHGHLTSNFAESENNKWLEDRNFPAHEVFVRYVDREAGQRYDRHLQAVEHHRAGHIICPTIIAKYEQQVTKARSGYNVLQLSAATAKITRTGCPDYQRDRQVNLETHTCTCTTFQQMGFPCRHAIVFAQQQRLPGGMNLLSDAQSWYKNMFLLAFRVENLLNAYKAPLNVPLREEVDADGSTLPQLRKEKKRGRDNTRRHASAGEPPGGKTAKRRRCGNCGEMDHNSRTCRRPRSGFA
jgi:hypothetical protein